MLQSVVGAELLSTAVVGWNPVVTTPKHKKQLPLTGTGPNLPNRVVGEVKVGGGECSGRCWLPVRRLCGGDLLRRNAAAVDNSAPARDIGMRTRLTPPRWCSLPVDTLFRRVPPART